MERGPNYNRGGGMQFAGRDANGCWMGLRTGGDFGVG